MVLPCCTSADLSESSSLETVVIEGSSSDNVLTLGDFVSDFTFSLLSSSGISSSVSICTSPSGVGTVVTESKSVVFAVFDVDEDLLSYTLATKPEIPPRSLALYLAAVRSYFAFYDIDVIPSKFRKESKSSKAIQGRRRAIRCK